MDKTSIYLYSLWIKHIFSSTYNCYRNHRDLIMLLDFLIRENENKFGRKFGSNRLIGFPIVEN